MADDSYQDNADCAAMVQQKQLPLRQQRDKPVLKYSGHGNSYLNPPSYPTSFTRGPADEVVHTKQAMSTEMLASYMNGTTGVSSCVYPSQFMPRSSQVPFANYTFNSGSTNGMGLTPTQILSANIAKYNNASIAVNPYTRPFSACDIQPPDGYMGRGQNGVVTNMATFARTSSTGCIDAKKVKASVNGTSNHQTVQTNAFMRPRSASRSEGDKSASENSRGKGVNSMTTHTVVTNHTHTTRDRGYVSGENLYVKPPQDGSTEPNRNGKTPHAGDHNSRMTEQHHMGDVAKTAAPQTTESLPPYANKIMPRPPTIDKTRPNVVDKPAETAGVKALSAANTVMKRVSNVYSMSTKNSTDVYQRPPATATMAVYRLHTGSNVAAANATGKGASGAQHPVGNVPMMTGTAIHNPNYTPAKPYNELSSGSGSSASSGSGKSLSCKQLQFTLGVVITIKM